MKMNPADKKAWESIAESKWLFDLRQKFIAEVAENVGIDVDSIHGMSLGVWTESMDRSIQGKFFPILNRYTRLVSKYFWYVKVSRRSKTLEKLLLYRKAGFPVKANFGLTVCKLYSTEEGFTGLLINPSSSITDVREHLGKLKGEFTLLQTDARKALALRQKKRSRKSIYLERDKLIRKLWQCSTDELRVITELDYSSRTEQPRRKDILISKALEVMEYKVSPDHVRKIVGTKTSS